MHSTVRQAKTLTKEEYARLIRFIDEHSPMPERDRLLVALSFKAGLRAGEIAQIDMNALEDASGRVGKNVIVSSAIAKRHRNREIPMHAEVSSALRAFRAKYRGQRRVAVSSRDGRTPMSANAVTKYLTRLLTTAGFEDCSSHSGRRTFGTTLARTANKYHRSLRDVQKLLGHSSLATTERYVDVAETNRSFVASL